MLRSLVGSEMCIRDSFRAVQRSALCRSRRELSNAYLLAKFGFDTAENEPCQVSSKSSSLSAWIRGRGGEAGGGAAGGGEGEAPGGAGGGGEGGGGAAAGGLPLGVRVCKFLQIFGGLVLGCIKTKFCKKICVRQHFSSSTRCAHFCTAAISKFSQKSV